MLLHHTTEREDPVTASISAAQRKRRPQAGKPE